MHGEIETGGTKWSPGSDVSIDDKGTKITYAFQTAWSFPFGIYEKVKDELEKLSIEVWWFYADEDTGSNCGVFKKNIEGIFGYHNMEGNVDFSNLVYNADVSNVGEIKQFIKEDEQS